MPEPRIDPRAVTDWKAAIVGIVEQLRWPVTVVVVALIFRAPLDALLTAFAASARH